MALCLTHSIYSLRVWQAWLHLALLAIPPKIMIRLELERVEEKKMNLMLLPSIPHIKREKEVYPREGILDTVFFHIMCFPWNRSFKMF